MRTPSSLSPSPYNPLMQVSPPVGFINVHKPRGASSRAAVNAVARLVRPAKAGHAGTLDPLASGVLVVCVGRATRLMEYVQRMRKRYAATFLLGRQTATDDLEGEITFQENAPKPFAEELRAALKNFIGRIDQRPPQFSAVKVAGRRAYSLARAGKHAEIAPRPVDIYHISLDRYEYPEVALTIECGAGMYVRSLGRDLAASLGTIAVMSSLVRTAVGQFTLENSIALESLSPQNWRQHLQPPAAAIASLPQIELSEDQAARIRLGQPIELRATEPELAALNSSGDLLAILRARDDGSYKPSINIAC